MPCFDTCGCGNAGTEPKDSVSAGRSRKYRLFISQLENPLVGKPPHRPYPPIIVPTRDSLCVARYRRQPNGTLPRQQNFHLFMSTARCPWTVANFLTDIPGIRSRQHLSAACIPKMSSELGQIIQCCSRRLLIHGHRFKYAKRLAKTSWCHGFGITSPAKAVEA